MMAMLRTKKPFRILTTLFCALLLFGAAIPALAQAADEHNTVKVGFFAMDGYHNEDADGVRSGYGYDFMQLIGRYSNFKFSYVGHDKSWEEMQQMLLNGEIDVLTSAQKTPEREALFDFSSTQMGTSVATLTVKAGDSRYANRNYDGMRVGLVSGSTRNESFATLMAERGFTYTPVYYGDINALTAALQKGTDIDAIMTSSLRGPDNEWVLEEFDSAPFYTIVRKGDTELLAKINDAIELMDIDSAGWRTKLNNKYYSKESGETVSFTSEERVYLDELRASGRTLKVTMNPDCAPYSYFENGEPRGIIADIFAEVASRMDIDYEMVKPADRAEYRELCLNGGVDVILDGLDDFYSIEENNLKITDSYYTAPFAAVSTKANADAISTLIQPIVSPLNEMHYSSVFEGKTLIDSKNETLEDVVAAVKSGQADGTIMTYYSAQWLCNADVTGQLKCILLPGQERSYVYAVSADEDYRLLASLNKTLGSFSEAHIAAIVAQDTVYPDTGFSIVGFIYQNLAIVIVIAVLFIALVVAALNLVDKNRRAQKELARSRRMERYIGYLCDVHYKVLEVDLDLCTRKQYMKRGDTVEIEESNDFAAFDIESIYPDDVEASLAVFDPAAVRAMMTEGVSERYVESRMKGPDGHYRWYSFLLKSIPADEEHPCSAMLLIKDVDDLRREREHNHDMLQDALDTANAASSSKSAFLSSMSHEIRTPLNAVIGYMTIASASIDNREKLMHCIDSAGVAARHLLGIINDVLDISAMESGKMKLNIERFDLKEQLSSIAAVFYQQCKQKNVEFTISINDLTEEWVLGDSMRVNQILMNLMSNAVKFTESKGSVNLTVVQTSQTTGQVFIQFIVSDTGIGISEEYMSHLFAPFEQESAQTTKRYGGTGLGMSITLNLVNLMGGNIDVASIQGEGSTFTVTLPFGRTENDAPKTVSHDLSHLRVLVVDDLENECEYINALLKRCGVFSETAHSGEEAIRLVTACKNTPEQFDLCIIDWNMPGLNGVETTRKIHRECDPGIPIIIATAYDIAEFEEEALSAGAARIVSKPLFQSTILDLLVTTYGKYDVDLDDEDKIPDLSGMYVLLAEDNEMNVEVAIDILEIAGVEAAVARNGKEAVEMFLSGEADYDAILMDVQMPIMDGYAATKAIRESSHEKAKTIPIIALTADAFAENVANALAAGMDDHVAKPIETGLLFSILERIYKDKRMI